MSEKQLCPVCGKVVGAWHKTGVHPKCQNVIVTTPSAVLPDPKVVKPVGIFDPGAQAQRDAILRRINGAPRQRS